MIARLLIRAVQRGKSCPVAAFRSIVDAASLKANQWVQAFQNPFGKQLSTLFDPIAKAQAAGTLTYQQASDALTQFNQQWTAYQQAADQYKSQGGDWSKVIQQSLDPNGDFMKTVSMVQSNLTNWSTELQQGDANGANPNAPSGPPTLQTILSGLGLTPQDAARSAAVQTQKRALAAPGYTGTILGGAAMQSKTQRPTLLGF